MRLSRQSGVVGSARYGRRSVRVPSWWKDCTRNLGAAFRRLDRTMIVDVHLGVLFASCTFSSFLSQLEFGSIDPKNVLPLDLASLAISKNDCNGFAIDIFGSQRDFKDAARSSNSDLFVLLQVHDFFLELGRSSFSFELLPCLQPDRQSPRNKSAIVSGAYRIVLTTKNLNFHITHLDKVDNLWSWRFGSGRLFPNHRLNAIDDCRYLDGRQRRRWRSRRRGADSSGRWTGDGSLRDGDFARDGRSCLLLCVHFFSRLLQYRH